MTEETENPNDPRRTIMLLYGMMPDGNPFWVFVAVKQNSYQTFIKAHKEGALDLYAFEPYGEIIVSGEGKSPPDEITLKVAEMYQTDPNTLFKNIKNENAVDAGEKSAGNPDKKTSAS